jgi:hypothetical protein
MGFGVWVGVMVGFAAPCMANSVQRFYILKHPWEHCFWMTTLGICGYYHDKYLPILREKNREKEKELGYDSDELLYVPWDPKGWLDRSSEPVPPIPPISPVM